MSVSLRVIYLTLILIATLSLIIFTLEWLPLSNSFADTNGKVNLTFQFVNWPCFTVGFTMPTRIGLGNQLFFYAGAKYVAWLTGRKHFLLTSRTTKLEETFDLDIARQYINKRCTVKLFVHKPIYGYDIRVADLKSVMTKVSIHLDGTFFSWKYTQPIEDHLRRNFRFRRHLTDFAKKFLSSNIPYSWKAKAFVRVGIHVRRGNFLDRFWVRVGLTVATKEYLHRAMNYFVERYRRVQFIVASNDIVWCQRNMQPLSFNQDSVNVTFSVRHSVEQDLALLAGCNHTIATTGTFGWWASWLANGTTVYYSNFARPGSQLWRRSLATDYFPSTWIGMN